MFSATEERLRTFVEKLAGALTEEVQVDVRPGDAWAAYPGRKPPLLTFRLADVAVIGDEILSVTAHEIGHLLYTDPAAKCKFDVGKFPRAAHLLLNAVEDSRIERIFCDDFPGARSLFDRKSEFAYDGKVQRGFDELPAKWRFVLNVDRVLHGLEPWGDRTDIQAIELALDHVIKGMWEDSTQACADNLEVPFRLMVELMKREKLEDEGIQVPPHLELPPELLGLPSDYTANAPPPDEGEKGGGQVSARMGQPAGQDDNKDGGTDNTDGKRQLADGSGSGEGQQGVGEGSQAGNADDGDGEGVGAQAGGEKGGAIGDGGKGKLASEFGDPNDPKLDGDDPVSTLNTLSQDKPTNIVEEMVNEELSRGSNNKTIDILSYRQRQRAKEVKEIERQMDKEKTASWRELLTAFGRDKFDKHFEERMRNNGERYDRDRSSLDQEIRVLRTYARTVLRDNATQRYGGNRTSGRKIKTHRLFRLENDDPRLFERKEEVGGKSYAIAVVVDQSSSMAAGNKSQLAYRSALVFLEAFEGLVDTTAIGFSDIGRDDPGGFVGAQAMHPTYYGRYRRQRNVHSSFTNEQLWRIKNARTYKPLDADLKLRKLLVPELERTYSSTPMEYGMAQAIDELVKSPKEVRAILIITDGEPNNEALAAQEFVRARKQGIETYALYIGGRTGDMATGNVPRGLTWLGQVADRVVEVRTTAAVPQAVYNLLKGVVRRRRYSVA